MFYTTFDGTGYRTGLAKSPDLLDWEFSTGIIFDRNPTPGTYDYGGVTFGCPLYQNASVTSPRRLRQRDGKYWVSGLLVHALIHLPCRDRFMQSRLTQCDSFTARACAHWA